ncbi:MAG TPA: penicillin-binding transpeptidase domain-containing protein, partial [Sediminibacterium sp.]|nr:penicillin-binding transpeptidase domain-containing protein [Sediminibacterium sp.]
RTFGLGQKLGIDLPSEKSGLLPTTELYNKWYKGHFNSCTIISNAIGQGEVLTTLLQLSNVMCIIANKGAFYTPHFVDSIEGGDEYHMLDAFHEKHHTDSRIPDSIFDAVQDGMQAVVDYGTAVRSRIPGIIMCGKTGTVENTARINGRAQKLQDHSFFGAFAPRDKPRIAIAVICENAGQGAWAAAPIASLMVEKYLRDSIVGPERKAFEKEFMEKNLIPQYMREEMAQMARRDSAKQARENRELQRMNRESTDSSEEEENLLPEPERTPQKSVPVKKTGTRIAAILLDEKRNRKIPGLSR